MPVTVNRSEQTRASAGGLMSNPAFRVMAFFAIHVPLSIAMHQMSSIGTLHAGLTAIVGIWWAMRGRMERVAYVAAYIAGAEVLWRMNGAEIFWEFAKYAISAMFLIALLRLGRLKGSTAAFLYFTLLLPSTAQTLMNLDLRHARNQISFNLSGPFALMLSVWFCSNIRVSKVQLQRIFLAFMGPVAGIASVAAFGTLTAAVVRFSGGSNFEASGGFGPNQVSALLGLGAFLAFFCLIHDKTSLVLRVLLIASIIVFGTQSAMTFSRGGLYAAAGSAVLAGFFLIRDKRGTARLLQVAPVLFLVAVYVIVPQIVAFTGGAITERFQKTNLTRRGDLIQADLQIWRENPIFGVGPGMGADMRGHFGEHIASHTEFARLLSEHGIFGIAALAVLLGIGMGAFLRAKGAGGRALSASLVAWSFLFMFANGMRLVAPSFIFGLACATILEEKRLIRRVRRAVPLGDRIIGSAGQEPWNDPGSPATPSLSTHSMLRQT